MNDFKVKRQHCNFRESRCVDVQSYIGEFFGVEICHQDALKPFWVNLIESMFKNFWFVDNTHLHP